MDREQETTFDPNTIFDGPQWIASMLASSTIDVLIDNNGNVLVGAAMDCLC